MASLSSLYLHERVRALGTADVTVASLGTTVLTARREAFDRVRIMTRRTQLGVSALPTARQDAVLRYANATARSLHDPREYIGSVVSTKPQPSPHTTGEGGLRR